MDPIRTRPCGLAHTAIAVLVLLTAGCLESEQGGAAGLSALVGARSPQTAWTSTDASDGGETRLNPAGKWIEGFAQGYDWGVAQQRPMLLVFSASGCRHCASLEHQLLACPELSELLSQFTVIRVRPEIEPEVCRRFAVRAWPTLEFLSPSGVPLARRVGCPEPRQLVGELRSSLEALAERPLASPGVLRR